MSDEKSTDKQFAQEDHARPQVDALDAQYKTIGIPAVSAAAGVMKDAKHHKKHSDQMN